MHTANASRRFRRRLPNAARRLWEQLGLEGSVTDQRVPGAAAWGGTPAGTRVRRGDALFPRLEE